MRVDRIVILTILIALTQGFLLVIDPTSGPFSQSGIRDLPTATDDFTAGSVGSHHLWYCGCHRPFAPPDLSAQTASDTSKTAAI